MPHACKARGFLPLLCQNIQKPFETLLLQGYNTPTGGHIRFEVEELPRNEHYARYRFVVQDDGIGMSEDYQKILFDPFTREEKSGTNKVQGTGLGMAITKSVVDLMGGSISVESATGKGTRFEAVLEFPIDTETDAVQKA